MKPTPNAQLQTKLREMVEEHSLYGVSSRLDIGRETILRYLAGLSMSSLAFRGIEVTLSELPAAATKEER